MNDFQLTETINKSGFPLQIGIEHLVKTRGGLGWKVLYSEHAWKSLTVSDEGGFIDLVLESDKRDLVLVTECKRVLETDWIFLVPNEEMGYRRASKAWVTQYAGQGRIKFYWDECSGEPVSRQSGYCVVRTGKSKAMSTLENIGSELAASTEGLAWEEDQQGISRSNYLRVYFNVVITTAKLKVCHFDPKSISLSDGEIKDPAYEDVPYVRFRKQFSTTTIAPNSVSADISRFITAKENTIFVVNSDHVIEFLNKFGI